MSLDPLILRPWEIARLTDHQIERLYSRPAAKRAQETQAPVPGGGGGQGRQPKYPVPDPNAPKDLGKEVHEDLKAGRPPSRAAMVTLLRTFGGMSQQAANEEYDRQLELHNRRVRGERQ